jgi:hypothetical protein
MEMLSPENYAAGPDVIPIMARIALASQAKSIFQRSGGSLPLNVTGCYFDFSLIRYLLIS